MIKPFSEMEIIQTITNVRPWPFVRLGFLNLSIHNTLSLETEFNQTLK